MGKKKGNKMKASLVQNTVDSPSFVESSVLSDTLCGRNQSSGLTKPLSNLTIDDSVPVSKFQLIQCCFILIEKTNCLK